MCENNLEQKMQQQGTALSSILLCSPVTGAKAKNVPKLRFPGHSLANARLTLHLTSTRVSQHFPCKRLFCSLTALSGRKAVLVWSRDIHQAAECRSLLSQKD